MDFVTISDLITLLATICAFVVLLIFWKNNLSFYTKIILTTLLSLNLFHSVSNFLEWSHITNFLDPYEDFIQVLKPISWFTLFFVFLQEISEKNLRNSRKKYRESYNRAEFYKDLFAHDINNILQNILTAAELCNIYQNQPDKTKETGEIFNTINEQVIRGSKLVSNIRKLSELEDSELLIEPVEIRSIIKELIGVIENKFQDKSIKIQVDDSEKKIFALADNLLREVFENLLVNSVRHNKNDIIEILVKISSILKEGKNYVKLEFIDNGIGIEDIRKDLIFQRERKKDNLFFGQGLGLSLVKKIIDIYNGQIWVEDKVPGEFLKGSNFVILLPEALQNE